MLGSHALHISRRGTSEVDEQSVPLASSRGDDSTQPAAIKEKRRARQARRSSLVDPAFARALPESVQLGAIAQVTEDPRRASIAIRRQSLIQSLQDASLDGQTEEYGRPPARRSITALPLPGGSADRIGAYQGPRYSIAEQGRSQCCDCRASRLLKETILEVLYLSCAPQSAKPVLQTEPCHHGGAAHTTEEGARYSLSYSAHKFCCFRVLRRSTTTFCLCSMTSTKMRDGSNTTSR